MKVIRISKIFKTLKNDSYFHTSSLICNSFEKEASNFPNDIHLLQNLVFSFGTLQLVDFRLVKLLVVSCGEILVVKKLKCLCFNRGRKLDYRKLPIFLCHFFLLLLCKLVADEFKNSEANEFRTKSIKMEFTAPCETMNPTSHGEFDRDKDALIYKYQLCISQLRTFFVSS